MWIYTSAPIRLHGVVLNWLSTGTTLPLPYTLTIEFNMFGAVLWNMCILDLCTERPID
jgi:hypothetical protein